jgi:hypothetical protein
MSHDGIEVGSRKADFGEKCKKFVYGFNLKFLPCLGSALHEMGGLAKHNSTVFSTLKGLSGD